MNICEHAIENTDLFSIISAIGNISKKTRSRGSGGQEEDFHSNRIEAVREISICLEDVRENASIFYTTVYL